MKKNSFIKCIAVGLAATLALAGCDSGGSDPVIGSSGSGGDGGGVSGTGSSGTGTGGGLTGASSPTTGTGGGTGGTGTGGTATATTDGGTDDGGGDSGTDGGATNPVTAFLKPLAATPRSQLSSLTNPSQMVELNNRLYFIAGFNQQDGTSRLMSAPINGTGPTVTLGPAVQVAAAPGSPLTNSLVFPFGLETDGTNLYISVGCNPASVALGNGAILKVSGFDISGNTVRGQYSSITASLNSNTPGGGRTIPVNPSFLLHKNGYIYWSEYAQQNTGGGVRRIRTSPSLTEDAETVANGLNYPSGLAADNANSLLIADAAGGAGALGQVVKVPLVPSLAPATPVEGVNIVTSSDIGGIQRPFDIAYDGVSGFFFTEGNTLVTSGSGGFGSIANPRSVQYLPQNSLTSRVVVSGVTQGAGIHTTNLGSGNIGILFSEGILSGRVLRAVVATGGTSVVPAREVFSQVNQTPFDTLILDRSTPVFLSSMNLASGTANGRIDLFRP